MGIRIESLRPYIDRADILIPPGSGGRIFSLSDYLLSVRAGMRADALRRLATRDREIAEVLARPAARSHGDLQTNGAAFLRLLSSHAVSRCSDPLPLWLAEAGVAIDYLLEGNDLIPDEANEIGLTDDARLVALVFARNPELGAFL